MIYAKNVNFENAIKKTITDRKQNTTTKHFQNERIIRYKTLVSKLGIGKVLCSFEIDNNHPNGTEYHIITSTGLVLIYNARTMRLVTIICLRAGQLYRYYAVSGEPFPVWFQQMMDVCKKNEQNGYNYL